MPMNPKERAELKVKLQEAFKIAPRSPHADTRINAMNLAYDTIISATDVLGPMITGMVREEGVPFEKIETYHEIFSVFKHNIPRSIYVSLILAEVNEICSSLKEQFAEMRELEAEIEKEGKV